MEIRSLRNEYDERRAVLNLSLAECAARYGLGASFEELTEYQVANGFIPRDEDVRRYALGPYTAIVRPGRGVRHLGIGRVNPPAGVPEANGGCFLCPDNVFWKSNGLQFSFDVTLHREYVALCQPFPIESKHLTLALGTHDPKGHASLSSPAEIRAALRDLIELAARLPGWIAFLNGRRAGASIVGHHHLQVFKRFQQDFRFPLEIAGQAALETDSNATAAGVRVATTVARYPVVVLVAEGSAPAVLGQLTTWSIAWKAFEHADLVCANWIAIGDPSNPDMVRAFFVPRSPLFATAPGMAGDIASVECLGEVVLITDQARARVESGDFGADDVPRVLKAVEPRNVHKFVAALPNALVRRNLVDRG